MPSHGSFLTAARRYRAAQDELEKRRQELRTAMLAARAEGMTLAAMAEALGVSRQRVMQILKP